MKCGFLQRDGACVWVACIQIAHGIMNCDTRPYDCSSIDSGGN